MPHLQIVPTAPSRPAPRTSMPAGGLDAPIDAAGILGRIIDFFELVESSSGGARERARHGLVAELERRSRPGSRASQGPRQDSILTAALACLQATSGPSDGSEPKASDSGSSWGTGPERAADVTAESRALVLGVQRLLEGVAAHGDQGPGSQSRVADVLAHMLRGPEPRTWSSYQRTFARRVLGCLRRRGARMPGPSPTVDVRLPRRWATRP